MPYLVLKDVSVRNVNGDSELHQEGEVLSDWEVEEFVKQKVEEGSLHYRTLLEPLTDEEAFSRRAKDTTVEGDHMVDGQWVNPPWEDYVGLHPEEIIERLRKSTSRDEVAQVRLYERGGQSRSAILDYVAPVERPPIHGYDDLAVREVVAKLEVLSDEAVNEVKTYEAAHRKRPAIITWERSPEDEEHDGESEKTHEEVAA